VVTMHSLAERDAHIHLPSHNVGGGAGAKRARCACPLMSVAAFGSTARSKPGSIAWINALCSTSTNACQVETPGVVSLPVRSTSVATS
jgi:hypothetical protein